MKQFLKRPESGKTILEILAVLVMIGLLTLLGFWGYSYAMNLYRANRIVTGAQDRSLIANVQRKIGENLDGQKKRIEEPILNYETFYDPEYPLGGSTAKKITISGFSFEVCQHVNGGRGNGLKSIKNWTKLPVRINGIDIDGTPACKEDDTNELEFFIARPGVPTPVIESPCAGCECECDEANGICVGYTLKKGYRGKCCTEEYWENMCPDQEPEGCTVLASCGTCNEDDSKNDVCHECIAGEWKLIEAEKTNVCGTEEKKCCGEEGCNSLNTGCKVPCTDTPNACQYCDDSTGTLKYTDDTKTTPCGSGTTQQCCGSEGCNTKNTGCKKDCTDTPNACQECDDEKGELKYTDKNLKTVCGTGENQECCTLDRPFCCNDIAICDATYLNKCIKCEYGFSEDGETCCAATNIGDLCPTNGCSCTNNQDCIASQEWDGKYVCEAAGVSLVTDTSDCVRSWKWSRDKKTGQWTYGCVKKMITENPSDCYYYESGRGYQCHNSGGWGSPESCYSKHMVSVNRCGCPEGMSWDAGLERCSYCTGTGNVCQKCNEETKLWEAYNDGAPVGECGKCSNGEIVLDETKVDNCQTCTLPSGKLQRFTNPLMDSNGKCCIDGDFIESDTCTCDYGYYRDGLECKKCIENGYTQEYSYTSDANWPNGCPRYIKLVPTNCQIVCPSKTGSSCYQLCDYAPASGSSLQSGAGIACGGAPVCISWGVTRCLKYICRM